MWSCRLVKILANRLVNRLDRALACMHIKPRRWIGVISIVGNNEMQKVHHFHNMSKSWSGYSVRPATQTISHIWVDIYNCTTTI